MCIIDLVRPQIYIKSLKTQEVMHIAFDLSDDSITQYGSNNEHRSCLKLMQELSTTSLLSWKILEIYTLIGNIKYIPTSEMLELLKSVLHSLMWGSWIIYGLQGVNSSPWMGLRLSKWPLLLQAVRSLAQYVIFKYIWHAWPCARHFFTKPSEMKLWWWSEAWTVGPDFFSMKTN